VGCEDPIACAFAAVPFSQECDATRDCNDYVCVQDVRYLIPSDRWPELDRLYMLEVHDCDQCDGQGKYQRSNTQCVLCGGTGKHQRSNTRCVSCGGTGKYQLSNTQCVSCGGTGKQIIAGGVG
jgi:ribosomal protein L32